MILATAWALGFLPRPMILAAYAQVLASAGALTAPVPVSARDSARLLHRARSAQSSFEFVHRYELPNGYDGGGGGQCDARVGRFCYWSDGDDDTTPPPPESRRVQRAREELVALLDTVAERLPGDAWVAGQRVRYRIDAGQHADALAAARSCRAAAWWCGALVGLALHASGEFAAADSAFTTALAELPEAERCRWTDLSLLLDDPLGDSYKKLDCARRDSLADRVWWLAAPLYLVGTQDLRTEILSRVTRARIEEHARPTQTSWGDDVRELMLRYGWPTWYSRVTSPFASMSEPTIIGHDPTPSFNFFPVTAAVDSPFTTAPDAFDLKLRTARARYAPAYLHRLDSLPHQLAVFRRGDSALVVAAFDAASDSTLAGRPLSVGLFLWTDAHHVTQTVREDSSTRQVLSATAPWRPLLIGIEALARKDRNAARSRVGRDLRPPPDGVSISDLLLYAPGETPPRELADALPRALPSSRVRRGDPLGLFWETYGLARGGEVLGMSLTIIPQNRGWLHRAAEALRLAHEGTPMSVRWREDADPATGIASRGVAVDLSRLPTGRYRIDLTVTPDGRPSVVVSRSIEVID